MKPSEVRLWRPVQTGGRQPFVVCHRCRVQELNETNRLHRAGWQETTGGPRNLMCGACAQQEEREGGRPPWGNPFAAATARKPLTSIARRACSVIGAISHE